MAFIPVTQLAQQAQSGYDAMQDSIRKTAAYNALRQTYGPVAGDPDNALRMQAYDYNRQMNPLQVQNQQLTNTARSDQNSYLAQSYPVKLQQEQSQATQDAQKVQSNEMSLGAQRAVQVRGVLGSALTGLGTDPGDPAKRGAAFDAAIQRSAGLLGADPAQLQQQFAAQRSQYMAGGPGAIAPMQQELDSAVLGSMSPADRQAYALAQQKQQLTGAQIDTQRARTGLVEAQTQTAQQRGAAAAQKAAQPSAAEFKAQQKALENATKGVETLTNAQERVRSAIGDWRVNETTGKVEYNSKGFLGNALRYASQMSASPAQALVNSKIPNTPEYNLAGYLQSLKDNAGINEVLKFRAAGGTFGNMTVREFESLPNSLTRLSVDMPRDDLLRELRGLGTKYREFMSKSDAQLGDFRKQIEGGADPATTQGIPAGPGGPQGAVQPSAAPEQPPAPNGAPRASVGTPSMSRVEPAGRQAIAAASGRHGVDPDYLARVAWIENKGRRVGRSSTGAEGPFQFVRGTASDFGLADRSDWNQAADAAARLTLANSAVLRKRLGRAPSQGELYLAHQQGAAGAAGLLANPNKLAVDVVGRQAVVVNGGKVNMTARQFANKWINKFGDAEGDAVNFVAGEEAPQQAATSPSVQQFGPVEGAGAPPAPPPGIEPSTAASYQPGAGTPPPGGPVVSGDSPPPLPGPEIEAAAVTGPNAVTPEAPQVAWEQVLPYLPELMALLQERRQGRA